MAICSGRQPGRGWDRKGISLPILYHQVVCEYNSDVVVLKYAPISDAYSPTPLWKWHSAVSPVPRLLLHRYPVLFGDTNHSQSYHHQLVVSFYSYPYHSEKQRIFQEEKWIYWKIFANSESEIIFNRMKGGSWRNQRGSHYVCPLISFITFYLLCIKVAQCTVQALHVPSGDFGLSILGG